MKFAFNFGLGIFNRREKLRQLYEGELASQIAFSEREYYQKFNDMYDNFRIVCHDYKYHLYVVRELLRSGNQEEIDKYLSGVEKRVSENEVRIFCNNLSINALLTNYMIRCNELKIAFNVEILLQDTLPVPSFDMCAVLGNLLENAVEACQKNETGRRIDLCIKPVGAQLAIMLKNTFDGSVICDKSKKNIEFTSMKKDGGFGLRSIQAAVARYGGEWTAEWDDEIFTAYVFLGSDNIC